MSAIRPEVLWFARKMEDKLAANDHKRHWSTCEPSVLLGYLKAEIRELEEALINRKDVVQECADVANFAMMIADNITMGNPK